MANWMAEGITRSLDKEHRQFVYRGYCVQCNRPVVCRIESAIAVKSYAKSYENFLQDFLSNIPPECKEFLLFRICPDCDIPDTVG